MDPWEMMEHKVMVIPRKWKWGWRLTGDNKLVGEETGEYLKDLEIPKEEFIQDKKN